MPATLAPAAAIETAADLFRRLGGVPASRVRLKPAPGTATEEDLVAALDGEPKLICELVDGVLVEKAMGTPEGLQGGLVFRRLGDYTEANDLGLVFPADSPFRLQIGLVRLPDVSFIPWDRIPGDEFPTDAVSRLIPTLTVEVLSPDNTRAEVARKLVEYFDAGVELAWVINPRTKTAKVHTSAKKSKALDEAGILDGGAVVPGFRLPLADVFGAGVRKRKKPRR